VLVVCAPAPRQQTDELVHAVEAARPAAPGKPLVACVFGEHPIAIAREGRSAVPVFDFPDDAAYALGRVTQYAEWRARPEGELVVPAGADPSRARAVIAEALAAGARELPVPLAVDVLRAAGIDAVGSQVVGGVEAAVAAAGEIGYPVAAKATGRTRLAKTEAGGVAIDIHDQADLRATLARMEGLLGDGAWPMVIQPMAEPGVDVAVGVTEHPLVGPVLTLGPGGAATTLATEQLQVLPLTGRDARLFVERSPLAALLTPDGVGHLEDLLLRVGALVEEAPELVGVELNPVIVSEAAATVVDATITVAPVERDPLPPVRRV
jgi:acyl-CoA synthetase (NDP forming)